MNSTNITEDICIINDSRIFDKTSFSEYKKSSLFTEWTKSILQSQYETACHYTSEIDCSLWQTELWDKMMMFSCKYIHLHNPLLPIFLEKQYKKFIDLHKVETPIQIRNNISHRKIICQIIGVLVYNGKGPVYNLPNIETNAIKLDEFRSNPMHGISQVIFKKEDHELVVSILNGLFIYLSNGAMHKALECLSIIIQIEKDIKKNKGDFHISPRGNTWIPPKTNRDWIWLVWEGILHWNVPNAMLKQSLQSLLFLFCYEYTSSKKNSRMCIIINAFLIICNNNTYIEQPLVDNNYKALISKACQNINKMYFDINEKYRRVLLEKSQNVLTTVTSSTPMVSSFGGGGGIDGPLITVQQMFNNNNMVSSSLQPPVDMQGRTQTKPVSEMDSQTKLDLIDRLSMNLRK